MNLTIDTDYITVTIIVIEIIYLNSNTMQIK